MRRRRAIVWVVAVVVVVGGAAVWYFLLRPPAPSDREQIITMVADLERAVEQKKVSDVMRYVAPDYQDPQGYDHRAVQRLVIAALRDPTPVDVVVQIGDMDIQGNQATLHVDADYSFGQPVGMGESQHVSVEATLHRERGGWKVVSAQGWQQAAGEAL